MYKALHQSIRSSEKLAELSDYAFRVWTQGLVASDVVGRISANPRKFHAEAMPMTGYDEAKMLGAFAELKKLRLCHFYDVEGKQYLVFHDHAEHNKTSKNLKYQHSSKLPYPPFDTCYCVAYTPNEEKPVSVDLSIDPSIDASVDPSTGVLCSSSSSSSLTPSGPSKPSEISTPSDEWERRMILVCESRGVPNKPETLRKWVRAMSGKLGPKRTEEILGFDASVANTPITDVYSMFCSAKADSDRKFVERRDASGPRKV